MPITTIRTLGALVAAGGILWGMAWILSPSRQGDNSQVEIWASGLFQLGLLGLLTLMWVTHATGTGRAARALLAAEAVAVVLALAWTVPYLFDANRPTTGLLVVLDAFWPLSMAGLIVVGAVVAAARRWPAPLRWLPLVAALLIPVDIAVSWAPERFRDLTMGCYLALSYGGLGLAIVHNSHRLASHSTAIPTSPRSKTQTSSAGVGD